MHLQTFLCHCLALDSLTANASCVGECRSHQLLLSGIASLPWENQPHPGLCIQGTDSGCPQERVVKRNRMWVAMEGRGWCLEIPLLPLHPNLQSPSSHPFLKRRGLEPTQDSSTVPALLAWVIRTIPLPHFPHTVPPALAAPELTTPAAIAPSSRAGQEGSWACLPPACRLPPGGNPVRSPALPFIINPRQPLDSALLFHLPWEGLDFERGAPAGRMVTSQLRTEARR